MNPAARAEAVRTVEDELDGQISRRSSDGNREVAVQIVRALEWIDSFSGVHPLALAYLRADAADEAYHRRIADAGTGWGPAEREAYKPVEAARIAASCAWRAARCPVEIQYVSGAELQASAEAEMRSMKRTEGRG